jgi:hypothetical protein
MGVRPEVDAVPITSPIQRVAETPEAVLHDFLDAAQAGPMPAVHHIGIAPLLLETVDRHFELQLLSTLIDTWQGKWIITKEMKDRKLPKKGRNDFTICQQLSSRNKYRVSPIFKLFDRD